jgi:hypothetical protein
MSGARSRQRKLHLLAKRADGPSLSINYTHTHTHTRARTHTHTNTHTRTRAHTHTHPHGIQPQLHHTGSLTVMM